MSGLRRLPPGLLDLVLARTLPASRQDLRRGTVTWLSSSLVKRSVQSAALLGPSLEPSLDPSLLAIKSKGQTPALDDTSMSWAEVSPFEERVLELKRVTETQVNGIVSDYQQLSEEEILAVYEDLLAPPSEAKSDVQIELDGNTLALKTVTEAASRLCPNLPEPMSNTPLYRTVLDRLEELASAAQIDVAAELPETEKTESERRSVAVPASEEEWQALIRVATDAGDVASADQVLNIIQKFGSAPSEQCLTMVLAYHAYWSGPARTDEFIEKSLTGPPTETQRDLHIKAHMRAYSAKSFPTKALYLLHDYEGRGIAPPQKTYSRLIGWLLHAGSSVAVAHAWDLFSHMRYVAHPNPSPKLYAKMIRACASTAISPSGEPERALDLFTEMTVDRRLPPTAEVYTATILACACSGRKQYVNEGFRLAKEMLDSHRDARGNSLFTPDLKFFCALLQGAKRIGDLARARWILAEMVRNSLQPGQRDRGVSLADDAIVKENVMTHVFHTYASYKPPFQRSMTVVADEKPFTEDSPMSEGAVASASSDTVEQQQQSQADLVPEANSTFSRVPPQTHAEVVQEAEALFSRVLADRQPGVLLDSEERNQAVFRHVELTSRLLNAYLSVYYAHSPVSVWRQMYKTLYTRLGVPKNADSYILILERGVMAKKGPDRETALQLAEEVWDEWSAVEKAWRDSAGESEVRNVTPRTVERAHSAMIRMLALTKKFDCAIEHVRAFVQTYPPSAIRETKEKPLLLSTRTSLVGSRPLIRLMSTADVPDDTVPPLLTFTELELLHHRLVAAKRTSDIKYLKWVCMSYSAALRARRDAVMHARPAKASTPEDALS